MAADVDAVIAALRITLDEAQKSSEFHWKTKTANRWISQLPGAWAGRWRQLKLRGDLDGEVRRTEFVGHVRATLAYLETNREAIRSMRAWSWPLRREPSPTAAEPIEAEFKDVTPAEAKQLPKPRKSVRLIK